MRETREIRHKHKLDVIVAKLEKGSLVNHEDFESVGIKRRNINNSLIALTTKRGLDVLSIKRGNFVLGWILASEVLK